MKKLLLSASALCALAALTVGSASASDLRLPVYKSAPVVCPTCNWTGFYVGINLGESKDWTSTNEYWTWLYNYPPGETDAVGSNIAGSWSNSFSHQYRHASMGFLGGLQWGYNWQVGSLLVGLEGDWNWSSERDTVTYGTTPVHITSTSGPLLTNSAQGWSSEEKIDWLTTWRARLGWAHDCYLWYVTAGVAWAKIETNYTLSSTPGASGDPSTFSGAVWGLPGGYAAANFSTNKVGWVVGGGVETSIGELFGLGRNWSMKLEYLYVDLGNVTNTFGTNLVPVFQSAPNQVASTGSTTFSSTNHVYEQIIRVGVNYRFSYAAVAPVVTK